MLCKINIKYRGVAQLVERVVWDHQAAGSSPVTPTIPSILTGTEKSCKNTRFFCPKTDGLSHYFSEN